MMNRAGGFRGAALIAVVASLAAIANLSGATFFGPSPYLSITNSPFYGQHFGYFHVENFEDGALNTPGVAVNGGIVAAPGTGTDSVDGDDGVIDGYGRNGYSYYSKFTLTNFTFTFSSNVLGKLPTHAGVVYTDSVSGFLASFEAFDRQGNSLGIIGPFSVGVINQNTGQTAEDRFFGVIHSDGISAIKISCNDTDWEIDHLQYGAMEDSAPVITNQPANTTAYVGEDTALTVNVYGRNPLSFQWQFNETDIISATNATLTLNAVSLAQAGDYRVVISNDLGVVTSTVARLTVVPPCTPVPSDLVSWWTADGHPFDLSGLNDATLLNGATYTNGFVGQAFYFDGQDDQVQAATAGLPTGTSDRTLEAWFKPDQDIGGFAWIAGYIDSLTSPGYNKSYSVGWYQGRVYWTAWGNIITGGPTISTGEWHHVAVASSNGFSRLYLDGVEIANNDSPTSGGNMAFNTPANSIFLMGNGLNLPEVSRKFNGAIDEVSIYGRALSSAEISAIYEAGVAGKCRPQVPPSLTGESLTLTTVLGEALTLTANASGTAPMVYQWYFNATNPIEGATARSLTIPAARLEDSGEYSVIVSNAYGIVTGVVARLTVVKPCTPVPPGLVGWWQAEGNGFDVKGINHATFVGEINYVAGKIGQAFNLSGSNGVSIPPNPGAISGNLTIEGWIHPANVGSAQPIVDYTSANGRVGAHLWIGYPGSGNLTANLRDTSLVDHFIASPAGAIPANEWSHIAITYNQATGVAVLYVNSSNVATSNLGAFTPQTANMLNLGFRPANLDTLVNQYFTGLLDEFTVYNRALSAQEIAAIVGAGIGGKCLPPAVACTPAPAGLVGWWQAEANALDSMGTNHAVATNGASFADGLVGRAFAFSGGDDAVTISASTNFQVENFTIEGWIFPNNVSTQQALVDFSAPYQFGLCVWLGTEGFNNVPGMLFANLRTSVGVDQYFTTPIGQIKVSEWTHIALTYNYENATASLYVNGQSSATASITLRPWMSLPLHLGSRHGHYGFSGRMDEFSFYNRALAANEISAIHAAGAGGKCGSEIPPSLPMATNITVREGESVTLNANASGSSPMSYQWFFNGTNLISIGASSVTISPARLQDTGAYSVVVTNAFGSVTGLIATLTVTIQQCAPVPEGLVAWWRAEDNALDSANFHDGLATNGTGFADGLVGQAFLLGGGNDSVTIPASTNFNVENFSVEGWIYPNDVSTQQALVEFSAPYNFGLHVWLGMNGFQNVPGMLFANLRTSTGVDQYFYSASGQIKASEWTHIALTYNYQSATASLYTDGNVVATARITSRPWTDLPLHLGSRHGHFGFSGKMDEFSFYNRTLASNEIAAIHTAGPKGKCLPEVPPLLAGETLALTKDLGESFTLTANASGTTPLIYQWYFNATNVLVGATARTLTIPAARLEDAGEYSVIVSNAFGLVTGMVARVTVLNYSCVPAPNGLVSWWQAESNAQDNAGANHGAATGGAGYGFGLVGNAFTFDGLNDVVAVPASSSLNVSNLTMEGWIYPLNLSRSQPIFEFWQQNVGQGVMLWINGDSGYFSQGVIRSVIRSATAEHHYLDSGTEKPIQSNQWQHIALTYDMSSGMGAIYHNGRLVKALNLGSFMPGTQYDLQFGGVPTTSYHFQGKMDEFAFYDRALTSNEITAIYRAKSAGKCGPQVPPSLTGEPLNITTGLGEAFALTANASGTAPLVYQWLFNATNVIEGATARTLTIPVARLEDSGEYSVIVSNAFGVVTGVVANVAVQPLPPTIVTQPASQSVLAGTPVDFFVGVSGTPPFFYQWYLAGEPLLDATNATLAIPAALGANAGAYQVAVSNELASVLSTTAVLTVTYPTAKVVLPSLTAPSGRTVTVPVYLVANGNENALQFSVGYSTSRLALVSIEPGEALGSASFLPNTNSLAAGRIGVALSLPSSQTFAFGTQEVARLVFNAAPQMNINSTTLNFYDTPIGRQLVDTQARVLSVNYVAGSLTLLPVEYEADVAPRGATDRRVMANDWVQVGRFVAALDTPAAGAEFQRADCAPRSEGGNGILSATDWVQAGRYTAGLDPLAVVSGPTDFATAPGLVRTVQLPDANNSGSCTVSVAEASVVVGQINRFQVTLTASGTESALTFTLRFDPAQLSFVYALAAQGTLQPMLNLNTNQLASGKLGVAVILPAGQSYAAGEQQVVNLEFQVAPTVREPIALDFDSTLIAREVSDAQAESMTTTWQGRTLPVVLPTPALAPSETPGTTMFRWPAALGNVLLEATDDLSAPDWRPVKQNPAEVNGQNEVAIPTDGAKKFYRLRSQ